MSGGYLALGALRPHPAWHPAIAAPAARNPERSCAECEAPHEDRAEVRHTQAAVEPDACRIMIFTSKLPLCDACAAAAHRNGWGSLQATWQKLISAPGQLTALLAASGAGRRH